MATTIQKYIYALFSIIVLLCSCDPLLVPQSGTQAYGEDADGHKYVDLGLSYIFVTIVTLILSILSQLGDLSASSIKREMEIKDY